MPNSLLTSALSADLAHFYKEDDLSRNVFYTTSLPKDLVRCSLKLKDDLTLAGLPFFFEAFNHLGARLKESDEIISEFEGRNFFKKDHSVIHFDLPFNIALMGERIALNLLQHGSSIASFTSKFVEQAKEKNIKILDTRKTTPGLRSLEKYAVRIGGGYNHRLGQTDLWMVKDNHKKFFGGVKEAVAFFQKMQGFYTPLEVEIHDLHELSEAIEFKINHVMLDNFSPEDIVKAVRLKPENMTYEVSGGIRVDTLSEYLIEGVDAISVGSMTYGAPSVDISLKYERACLNDE